MLTLLSVKAMIRVNYFYRYSYQTHTHTGKLVATLASNALAYSMAFYLSLIRSTTTLFCLTLFPQVGIVLRWQRHRVSIQVDNVYGFLYRIRHISENIFNKVHGHYHGYHHACCFCFAVPRMLFLDEQVATYSPMTTHLMYHHFCHILLLTTCFGPCIGLDRVWYFVNGFIWNDTLFASSIVWHVWRPSVVRLMKQLCWMSNIINGTTTRQYQCRISSNVFLSTLIQGNKWVWRFAPYHFVFRLGVYIHKFPVRAPATDASFSPGAVVLDAQKHCRPWWPGAARLHWCLSAQTEYASLCLLVRR